MKKQIDFNAILVIALIIFLGQIVFKGLELYFTFIVWSVIVTLLCYPLYTFLQKKNLSKTWSAILSMSAFYLIIILLGFFFSGVIFTQASSIIDNSDSIIESIHKIPFVESHGGDIDGKIQDGIERLGEYVRGFVTELALGIGNFFTGLAVLTILVYYLLLMDKKKLIDAIHKISPFTKKNTDKLISEFRVLSRSLIIVSGLVGLAQATVLTITFLILGIDNALFWGFSSFFASFIPIVGISIVWVPLAGVLLFQGKYVSAVILIILSSFVAGTIDNILRPVFQKKIGQIHPIISLIGIFLGLNYFGLAGIIFGPLIFAYFWSLLVIFYEEYM